MYSSNMTKPTLAQLDKQITIEHISALQERLGKVLEAAYPGDDISVIVNHHFDPFQMKEDILKLFTEDAFLSMFKSEMGKGVILGAFVQKYIFGAMNEE